MRYQITLATLACSPPCTATVEIEAVFRDHAEELALDLDFDTLEWTDDLGNPVEWDELSCSRSEVAVAEE